MTVTEIRPQTVLTPTEPLTAVPRREPAPMNASLFAHVQADTLIEAVRRREDGPIEVSIGESSAGAEIALFLHGDAAVIRLIEALQSVYAS